VSRLITIPLSSTMHFLHGNLGAKRKILLEKELASKRQCWTG
jgi:hypothetical protein